MPCINITKSIFLFIQRIFALVSYKTEMPNAVVARQKESQQTQFLSFPPDIGAHSILLIFNTYEFRPPGDRGLNRLTAGSASNRSGIVGPLPTDFDVIQLPMPANLTDNYNVRVQGNELGIAGAEIAGAASAFAGSAEISKENLKTAMKAALPDIDLSSIFSNDMSQQSRNLAFLGRRSINGLLPGAGRAIDQGLGNTTNPKASLFFEGVNLKQFDFNWTLAPTDRSESDRIRDITNTIKRHILPTYGNAAGLNKVLLNYPSTVDVFFLGVEDSYFMYFKTCMVQNFTVNYTPNGLAFVGGGKPAMVNLNMTLMEMDIHTSEDYGGVSTQNAGTATTEAEDIAAQTLDALGISGGSN